MDPLAAAVSFGTNIGDYYSAKQTNETNRDIAASNNAWSAEQFATRYQTTVNDLKSAGLNPMLAYSQGGGSPPTAQAVQFQNPARFSSAADSVRSLSDAQVKSASVENVKADTELKSAQAHAAMATADAAEAQARLNTGAAAESALRQVVGTDLTRAQTKSTYSQIAINKATLPKIAQEIVTGGAQAGFYRAAANKAIAEGNITRADLDRALNEQAMQRSSYGAIRPYVRDAIGAIGGIKGTTGAAADVQHARRTQQSIEQANKPARVFVPNRRK